MRMILSLALALGLGTGVSAQQEVTLGTGAATLTYAPVGDILATAVTGAGELTLRPVPSNGSLDNIRAIAEGRLDTGFAQSDIAFWAYEGTSIWSGNPPVEGLRTIAALYEEHIHLVTLADSGIETVTDLRNRRISLDDVGSGTHVDARLILEAAGLRSDEFAVETMTGQAAATALEAGEIDAFFTVAGYPTAAIADLAARTAIRLVPIEGEIAVELLWRHGFLARSEIPAEVYPGVSGVETVSVGAHWYTSDAVPEAVVYELTRSLFAEGTQARLVEGHPKGREMTPETALDGVAVPLHPGAVRFYEESGVME
ncbi:TAXI family TRAP transporter solute-binding subunit [Jannaschia marina]|uniref:TAXI family TRAP transporter solute-binding subunit n=1 Tax=Jannaschia marina TaxID=2741674 RepID=UPI0015CD6996|nr:TAXI family TRAP transporter solute-binding subunit [Jannaschia marina]